MQGALLNVFGTGVIVTDPTERSIGNSRYFSVRLGQYPPEEGNRQRDLLWVDLKARDQQRNPRKGDAIMIASATYDVGIRQTPEGETKRYHTLTAYVWRILPSTAAEDGTQNAYEKPAQTPALAPAKTSIPAQESAATPPPDIPDASEIPF